MLVRVGAGERVARGLRVLGGGDLAAVEDPDGLLGAHHPEFDVGPGEHVVGAQRL